MVLFAAGAVVGAVLAGGLEVLVGPRAEAVAWAALAVVAIGAGANAFNDYVDLDIDRMNRPDRPLPAGALSERGAFALWLGASLVGVGIATTLTALHGVLAVGAVGALAAYSRWLVRLPLVGNVVVAAVVVLALIFGAVTAGSLNAAVGVGGAFAFLMTLAREIVKDVEDVRGDRAAGRRTMPVAWGVRPALGVAAGVLLVALVLMPLPALAFDFSGLYLVLVAGAAVGAVRALAALLARDANAAGRVSGWIKVAMGCGLIALLAH